MKRVIACGLAIFGLTVFFTNCAPGSSPQEQSMVSQSSSSDQNSLLHSSSASSSPATPSEITFDKVYYAGILAPSALNSKPQAMIQGLGTLRDAAGKLSPTININVQYPIGSDLDLACVKSALSARANVKNLVIDADSLSVSTSTSPSAASLHTNVTLSGLESCVTPTPAAVCGPLNFAPTAGCAPVCSNGKWICQHN